ncbi:hypothetical protein CLF_102833 [Clonorchis sinensis]|uniref:Uncharacterized protein n=1 Tax=Clonorchis sinensis TaxID=79923 RepID=G7Y8L9_CLOSI|nr:hypothetical protein CLF_102833 [Clonorchis sinensis]
MAGAVGDVSAKYFVIIKREDWTNRCTMAQLTRVMRAKVARSLMRVLPLLFSSKLIEKTDIDFNTKNPVGQTFESKATVRMPQQNSMHSQTEAVCQHDHGFRNADNLAVSIQLAAPSQIPYIYDPLMLDFGLFLLLRKPAIPRRTGTFSYSMKKVCVAVNNNVVRKPLPINVFAKSYDQSAHQRIIMEIPWPQPFEGEDVQTLLEYFDKVAEAAGLETLLRGRVKVVLDAARRGPRRMDLAATKSAFAAELRESIPLACLISSNHRYTSAGTP